MRLLALWAAFARAEEDCSDCGNFFLQTGKHHLGRESYHWPSGRGRYPFFAVSEQTGPFELNESLAWSWHHPEGRFQTLTYGAAIDEKLNIYLSAADGLRKFDSTGQIVWEHNVLPAHLMNAPVIHEGKVYGSDTFGGVLALDMETGNRLWRTNLSLRICEDNGFNMVHKGVLFAAAECREPSPQGSANQMVKALNSSTGDILWSYQPDAPVWNFLPLFPDEETLVFQDMSGKAYRMTLEGELLWKAGGIPGTWTDGGAALGPNGMVYTVSNNHPPDHVKDFLHNGENAPGTLSAYDLHGHLIWQATTPRPPNNAPAVGRVTGWDGLSLIMPLCQQVMPGATCDVHAYDAKTGDLRWVFHGPTQKGLLQAGDIEGMLPRTLTLGERNLCLPNGWSAPSIAGDGTVYVGNEEGPFFALRDENGDGRVQGRGEMAAFDTLAAFSGSSSPALAPGTVAVASCDTLFVFKK